MILVLPLLSHSMLMLSEEELACAADSGRGNALAAFRSRKFNQLISASGFGPSFGCLTLEWNQKPCSGIGVTKKRPSLTTDLKLSLPANKRSDARQSGMISENDRITC